jgi:hypothetical protein
MSPQACEFFRKCCLQANVPVLELLLWVRTQWASLYKCLDRVLTLRKVSSSSCSLSPYSANFSNFQAIDLFVRLADDSNEVPDLRDKEYRIYTLSKREWEKIQMIHEALRVQASVFALF